jgi:hypothetical protein
MLLKKAVIINWEGRVHGNVGQESGSVPTSNRNYFLLPHPDGL